MIFIVIATIIICCILFLLMRQLIRRRSTSEERNEVVVVFADTDTTFLRPFHRPSCRMWIFSDLFGLGNGSRREVGVDVENKFGRRDSEGRRIHFEDGDVALALEEDIAACHAGYRFKCEMFLGEFRARDLAPLPVRREARCEVDGVAEDVVDELARAEDAGGDPAGVEAGLDADRVDRVAVAVELAGVARVVRFGEGDGVAGQARKSVAVLGEGLGAAGDDEEGESFDLLDHVVAAERVEDVVDVVHTRHDISSVVVLAAEAGNGGDLGCADFGIDVVEFFFITISIIVFTLIE